MADKSKSALLNAVTNQADAEDKKLIETVRRRFTDTSSNWNDIRLDSIQDQRFYKGFQYDDSNTQATRARLNVPHLQFNQLPNFVKQIENGIRQQNIGINVHATDEDGSANTAKVLQGMVRHIEHISNAKQAYIWAAGSHGALVPGFGFIKIDKEYCCPVNGVPSFDQELKIVGIPDPMLILPDFTAKKPDFSDAEFWFEFEEYGKDAYNEKYGDSDLAKGGSFSEWGAMGSIIGSRWIKQSSITVTKYWYKEMEVRHFAAFEDGTTGFLDDFGLGKDDEGKTVVVDLELNDLKHPRIPRSDDEKKAWLREQYDAHVESGAPAAEFPITEDDIPPGRLASVIKTREVSEAHVYWIVTNGWEILQRGEWDDSEFPFVGVMGIDEVIDGKRTIQGCIRDAKDAQKMLNMAASYAVEKIDAANKSAWIAPLESIPEPQRSRWERAHIDRPAILYYNHLDEEGDPIPPPTRGDSTEPAIVNLMQAVQQFNQQVKATVGIFEAGIGQAMGDRQSGAAINTLAQRGEISNMHFSDNLVMSIKRLGCLLLRLIPKIYDTARVVRIVGLDDEPDLVKINQMFTENGQKRFYDIKNASNYDVVVDTGPTFASRKAEQSEQMMKFAAVQPQLMPVIADLLAGNMDWDATGALKDRIQQWQAATMPFLHPANDQAALSPQARTMLQQLQQKLQEANQHVATLSQAYNQEKYKNDTQAVANQGKERLAMIKAITDLRIKAIDLQAQAMSERNQMALEGVKVQLKHINDKQRTHLDALKLSDQSMQQNDQATYAAIQKIIDESGPGTLGNTGSPVGQAA